MSLTIDDLIRKLQAVRDKHGNLPLVKYPDRSFIEVSHFDPSPVQLVEVKRYSTVDYEFVRYGEESPTHLEVSL